MLVDNNADNNTPLGYYENHQQRYHHQLFYGLCSNMVTVAPQHQVIQLLKTVSTKNQLNDLPLLIDLRVWTVILAISWPSWSHSLHLHHHSTGHEFWSMTDLTSLTLGAHAHRGLQQLSCVFVCLSVCLFVTLILANRALRRPTKGSSSFSCT